MYANAKTEEISLWCDGGCSSGSKMKRIQNISGGTSFPTEEEDVDEHCKILTEKHGDSFSVPQRHLWARTIHCGTHSDYDTPPPLPMFGPQTKKPKKEELSDTLANAAIAFTKAFRSPDKPSCSSVPVSSQVGISPGKSVDLGMKNLH